MPGRPHRPSRPTHRTRRKANNPGAKRDGVSRSVDVVSIAARDGRHTGFQGAGYPSKTLREKPERQKDARNDWIL